MSLSGARALITGGAGLIGSALARRLVHLDAQVTVVDSLVAQSSANPRNLAAIADRIDVKVADVRDADVMNGAVAGADLIFNLAGQSSHLDSMTDPFTDLDVNARGQLVILEAARRHNAAAKIVFASTRQLYGRPQYLPVDERHPVRPVDVNGINKLAGEGYHLLYREVYGLHACVLRLTNTYGPGMRIRDARQTFVGVWLKRVLEGQPFEVWGGEQLRDFNYVDDVVDALLRAVSTPDAAGRVFNLGSHEVVSLLQLAELLVAVNGGGRFEIKEFPAERKKIDIGDYYSEFGAIRAALGWQPTVSLRDGLQKTVAYFKEHLEHYV